jgi:hypothetical protein
MNILNQPKPSYLEWAQDNRTFTEKVRDFYPSAIFCRDANLSRPLGEIVIGKMELSVTGKRGFFSSHSQGTPWLIVAKDGTAPGDVDYWLVEQ